jgi:hypothetical protein
VNHRGLKRAAEPRRRGAFIVGGAAALHWQGCYTLRRARLYIEFPSLHQAYLQGISLAKLNVEMS